MANPLRLEVAHAVVYANDIDRLIDFYCRVLGFEVTDRGPIPRLDKDIVFLSQTANAHHQIAFMSGRPETGRSNSVDHLAFRSSGTLEDLQALKATLEAEPGVSAINPITHGNAWSIYFRDPEGNGVEVFIDTPWHVAQPQGRPLDLDRPVDEIESWTHETFANEREFGSIESFYQSRADRLAAANPQP